MKDKMILVSAGDCVTAKLVQEAGFDGIWISGFEASARLGLADNGSITMFEMLNIARPIVDAVKIPVYVDTDTGYGNFARTVKEFEAIGIAGVCVEDNLPQLKTNSLWGGKIPLMKADDFCKKINVKRKRIKIIARTEAIIRNKDVDEARERLKDYIRYGKCDIILPHTRDIKYLKNWKASVPVAIVPTKFPNWTNNLLFKMGYDMVIWANQTERVKIKATREALKSLKETCCAAHIENNLSASLDDMKGLMPDG